MQNLKLFLKSGRAGEFENSKTKQNEQSDFSDVTKKQYIRKNEFYNPKTKKNKKQSYFNAEKKKQFRETNACNYPIKKQSMAGHIISNYRKKEESMAEHHISFLEKYFNIPKSKGNGDGFGKIEQNKNTVHKNKQRETKANSDFFKSFSSDKCSSTSESFHKIMENKISSKNKGGKNDNGFNGPKEQSKEYNDFIVPKRRNRKTAFNICKKKSKDKSNTSALSKIQDHKIMENKISSKNKSGKNGNGFNGPKKQSNEYSGSIVHKNSQEFYCKKESRDKSNTSALSKIQDHKITILHNSYRKNTFQKKNEHEWKKFLNIKVVKEDRQKRRMLSVTKDKERQEIIGSSWYPRKVNPEKSTLTTHILNDASFTKLTVIKQKPITYRRSYTNPAYRLSFNNCNSMTITWKSYGDYWKNTRRMITLPTPQTIQGLKAGVKCKRKLEKKLKKMFPLTEFTNFDFYEILEEQFKRQAIKSNIIIFGLSEQMNELDNSARDVADRAKILAILQILVPTLQTSNIKLHRLGQYNISLRNPRPIIVHLKSVNEAESVISSVNKLRKTEYKNISIHFEKTQKQRIAYNECTNEIKRRRGKGEKSLGIKFIHGEPMIISKESPLIQYQEERVCNCLGFKTFQRHSVTFKQL